MKKKLKALSTLALALVMTLTLAPVGKAAGTYTPPYSTVRIGIYTYTSGKDLRLVESSERQWPGLRLQAGVL